VQAGTETNYFFYAIPGIAPEFVLDERAQLIGSSGTVIQSRSRYGLRLHIPSAAAVKVRLVHGVNLILLPEPKAEQVWRTDEPSLLLSTQANFFSDHAAWTFESDGVPGFEIGVFGTDQAPLSRGARLQKEPASAIFHRYKATLPEVKLQPKTTKIRNAATRQPWIPGPAFDWRPKPTPMAATDRDFDGAATWRITLPPAPQSATVSDAFLKIAYQGDAARLYVGHELIDDNFWNGTPWTIGLREVIADWRRPVNSVELRILPLPRSFPMYLEQADKLRWDRSAIADSLTDVQLVPQYRLVLQAPPRP
jgi:hypothetical protein